MTDDINDVSHTSTLGMFEEAVRRSSPDTILAAVAPWMERALKAESALDLYQELAARRAREAFPDAAATATLQNRDDTLRGLAEFFSESVHHVWSNDEIAQCLTEMIGQSSVVSSTEEHTPRCEHGNPVGVCTVCHMWSQVSSPQSEAGK